MVQELNHSFAVAGGLEIRLGSRGRRPDQYWRFQLMLRGKARFGKARLLAMLAAVCAAAYAPVHLIAGFNNQIAGVIVGADGVLRTKVVADPDGALQRQRKLAAQAALNEDVRRPSKLRKISLRQLEAALSERLMNGEMESEEMRYLAGLTRITHVFCYPGSQDIVIAGPAEGWMVDPTGRAVGLESGRATVLLEDLVVALRAFPSTGQRTQVISVSIDPTREGLNQLQQVIAQAGGFAAPGMERQLAAQLKDALGMQDVTFQGVSPQSHYAQVLVEADYRMKLIGIGLERPTVKITSFVSRANPNSLARNALQRWYFTPNYDAVKTTEDRLAMELVGQGVKLISEDELVVAGGGRVASEDRNPASEAFVQSFTRQYDRLAEETPVYAQLRNLIDITIAAAFIQDQDYYGQASWDGGVLMHEDQYAVENHNAPKQVESAVNAIWKGRRLMTPIGGGVSIEARKALATERLQTDQDGVLVSLRSDVDLAGQKPTNWWWD